MVGRRELKQEEGEPSEFCAGVLIGNRFRLQSQIGKGGMSSVWAAEDLVTGQRVAVKLMSIPERNVAQMLERFRREASVAKRLRGPNFASIIDFGQHEDGQYLAMQLLQGETLQARLARLGKLSIEDALVLLAALEAGLGIAHSFGVVHRDLKPANVFYSQLPAELRSRRTGLLRQGEVVKILDFGIARSDAFGGERLTLAGNIVGSLHYMSPEQAIADPDVDRRSDLWQVGALLYRCLSGRRPFEGPAGTVLARLATEDPAPICSQNPELPRALNGFFSQALARRREDRFETVAALATAFRQAVKQVSGTRPIVRVRPSFASGIPVTLPPGALIPNQPASKVAPPALPRARAVPPPLPERVSESRRPRGDRSERPQGSATVVDAGVRSSDRPTVHDPLPAALPEEEHAPRGSRELPHPMGRRSRSAIEKAIEKANENAIEKLRASAPPSPAPAKRDRVTSGILIATLIALVAIGVISALALRF